ncbi:MAG TPA: DUF1295 domain-containing protein [Candidatus Saccharimonadales bacterium]|nr:DUF1295 domain-containing protein [Candidatus Saccharimonadales bacterium]
MADLLIQSAALLWVFMTLAQAVARLRKRIDTVDIAWGLGFLMPTYLVLIKDYSTRSRVIATLVTIWSVRLATHIYLRSRQRGDDPRYAEITKKWKGNIWPQAYFKIFLLQGVLIWIISLPVVLVSNKVVASSPNPYLAAGIIIWLIGFLTETVADAQLSKFLQLQNRPKVLQTGLWHYSRHPNYFGELTQWWAIGIIALQVSFGWIGLLGPLTLTTLIIFISGIPPIEKRRAKDPEYRKYQAKTSVIVPWFPKNS